MLLLVERMSHTEIIMSLVLQGRGSADRVSPIHFLHTPRPRLLVLLVANASILVAACNPIPSSLAPEVSLWLIIMPPIRKLQRKRVYQVVESKYAKSNALLLAKRARQVVTPIEEEELPDLPQSYQDRFGTIAYHSFGKKDFPVLLQDPSDVPAVVRAQWLEQWKKRPNTHVFYYYGSKDANSCYGLGHRLKEHSSSWTKVQQRIEAGKKLTPEEEELQRAHQEMNEDLAKDPKDRRPRLAVEE